MTLLSPRDFGDLLDRNVQKEVVEGGSLQEWGLKTPK